MAKTLSTPSVETGARTSGNRRALLSGPTLLVVKNLLVWGSVALSCYALYRLAVYLIG